MNIHSFFSCVITLLAGCMIKDMIPLQI